MRVLTLLAASPAALASTHPFSPYSPDADTVALFHLDEPTGSTTAVNGGSLGFPGIASDPGTSAVTDVFQPAAGFFGGAAGLANDRGIGIDASGNGDFSTGGSDRFALASIVGPDNAFTLEALVKPSTADLSAHGHIWSGDSSGDRGFQFRIKNTEELEYNGLEFGGGNQFHPLPPLDTGTWYHVALSYTEAGQPAGTGQFRMFWTPVTASTTEAQEVHSWTAQAVDPGIVTQLVLGNEGRSTLDEGFPGLVDEARISRVARAADEFLFDFVDTDGDSLPDPWEQAIVDADPDDAIDDVAAVLGSDDFDLDTLTNLREYELGTDPTVANDPDDADGDGLADDWELSYFPSIWTEDATGDPDTDTATNGEEQARGTSPLVYDDPSDSDADGLPDAWEEQYLRDLDSDGDDDPDGDGFSNAEEFAATTDPDNPLSVPGDSDGDGMADDWELAYFSNLDAGPTGDPDGDQRDNLAEAAASTDPNDPLDYPGAPVDPARPTGLMVDLLALPHRTTIPDTRPEFAWIFHPRSRGEAQGAYEIIVASSPLLAGAGTGDVWSSGKVDSGDSINVPCGVELSRGGSYAWRVRTWGDSPEASQWSRIQTFRIESTLPQPGARSLHRASADDASGYNWAGRYQSAFERAVPPVSVIDKGNGNYFIDFGRADFGYATVRLSGSFLGQAMEVRFGEKASGDSVDTSPGHTIRYSSTTRNLSNGDVTYEIRPPATSFPGYAAPIDVTGWAGDVTPFRYLELVGCPGPVGVADIRQQVLRVPFDEAAAAFTSSDPTLDAVWDLCRHSIKVTTFCGAYVDGDRERTPYEADAYINQLSHYGVDREYTVGRYTYEYLLDHPTWPTEWSLHFPLMAWQDYLHTGNTEALAANYGALQDSLLLSVSSGKGRRDDGLYQGSTASGSGGFPTDIVDWPSNQRDGYDMSRPLKTVTSAFQFKALRTMAEIAGVLGNTGDAATYQEMADETLDAIQSTFWDPSNGYYVDGASLSGSGLNAPIDGLSTHASAHANFFPLALGIEAPDKPAVLEHLKSKRMSCSVYGAQYLLEALFEGGEADHAIALMSDDDPSYPNHWWNMIREGSTITMESWDNDQKANIDWNHAWGAAPANLIPRYVLGVRPLEPGFGRVVIEPRLGTGDGNNGLSHASGTVPSIRGPIEVEVSENSPTTFRLRVRVPGNVTARVSLPDKGLAGAALVMDGAIVAEPLREDGRLVVADVPSGEHAIWLSATDSPTEAVLRENWKRAMFGDAADDPLVSGDSLDPDFDGVPTGDEFIANTDPLDPTDHLRIGTYLHDGNAGAFELTVAGRRGRRYRLDRSTELAPGSWTELHSTGVVESDRELTFTDPDPPAPRAFYRIEVQLP